MNLEKSPQQGGPPLPSPFSAKRGAKHAGLAALVLVLLALGALPWAADPHRFGEGVGRFVVVAFGIAFAVSYLWQTGRRRWALAIVGTTVALMATVTVLLVVRARAERPALTAAERAPPMETKRSAASVLEHPAFGFRVNHPGPAFISIGEEGNRALEGAFPDRQDVAGWGFRNPDTGDGLFVIVMKEAMQDEEGLRGIVAGFREALEKAGGKAKVLEDRVTWTAGDRSVFVAVELEEGASMVTRFRVAPDFVVGVIASLGELAASRAAAESLSLRGE